MKTLYSFSFCFLLLISAKLYFSSDNVSSSAAFQGAWETNYFNEEGNPVRVVTILQDSFMAETIFNIETKTFYKTVGGSWSATDKEMTMNIHFDSKDADRVGTSSKFEYKMDGDKLTFTGDNKVWTKVDSGNSSDLANPWFFSGRMRDGEMSRRPLRARKTMKILSDTRFQWIAYNDETGAFSGTGGGTYTAVDGKYTENIEFFSKNADRVGASLSFNFEVKDNEWHHTGFSSKGDPMYEIWAPIQMIAKPE